MWQIPDKLSKTVVSVCTPAAPMALMASDVAWQFWAEVTADSRKSISWGKYGTMSLPTSANHCYNYSIVCIAYGILDRNVDYIQQLVSWRIQAWTVQKKQAVFHWLLPVHSPSSLSSPLLLLPVHSPSSSSPLSVLLHYSIQLQQWKLK